ncbi:hypothetical protein [Myroides odoratimimus]|uniref:hypothetical protein n=1 Tax=Myroides odoratimimus TaxID=76832 RepID=UPI003101428E
MIAKKIIPFLFLLLIKITFAQPIGINTTTPASDLHVNGSVSITNELNIGGSATMQGTPGLEGQALISNGINLAPYWATLNIPTVLPGSYSLTKSLVLVDDIGIILKEGSSKTSYKENESITLIEKGAEWVPLTELISPITITDPNNKVSLILQTIAHISREGIGTDPKFSFAIGFFIEGKLKSVKPFIVKGTGYSFTVVTLISTIENLPIGTHELRVAAIPRVKEDYKGVLAIGKKNPDPEATNISPFMAKTSLKVDIYEQLNK